MLSRIIDYFRDEEDHDPSFIGLTRNIVIFVILINTIILPLVTGLIGEGSKNPPAFIAITITLILEIISLFLIVRRKNLFMAKVVIPFVLMVAITAIALNLNGLKSTSILALPVALSISALLLGKRFITLATPIAIIAVIVIAIFDLNGKIPFTPAGLDDAILVPLLIIGFAGTIQLLIGRLNENINRARVSEQIHKVENIELTELRAKLEDRVHQRTLELETANEFNMRRARQFEAIVQVNRAITSIQDLDILLPRITQVISEQFNNYHTGIFLLDENREFAILRAANSEGGNRMLNRGHKLQVSQTGIVGFVTASGQPRIARDVGNDAVYFDNPDLPNTHSEIALPLRYEERVIGALDVQSTESNAFNQDDMEVLGTLADQVSAAINTTLAIESAKKSLSEAQSSFGKAVQEAWKIMRPTSTGMGFELKNSKLIPLEQRLEGDHIHKAVTKGVAALSENENAPSSLAIPIRLRGQIIGVMNLRSSNQRKLTNDDADIAKAVSERLSLAIETATLLQSTQHRADVERLTTEISAKIGSSTRFETILKTAAEELSKALSGSDVLVQIEPISIELGMEK